MISGSSITLKKDEATKEAHPKKAILTEKN